MLISGCIGPRGDGYRPGGAMTEAEAESYHSPQAQAFAGTGSVQLISGITMTSTQEAIGVRCVLSSCDA